MKGKLKFAVLLIIVAISMFSPFFISFSQLTYVAEMIEPYKIPVVFAFAMASAVFGFPILVADFIAAISLDYFTAVLVILTGVTLGSIGGFYLTRYLGRDYLEQSIIFRLDKLKRFDANMENNGFWLIFFLRIFPLFPFQLVNVVGGVSRMHFRDYIAATLLGAFPGIVLFVYFIKSYGTSNFLFAGVLLTLFSLTPFLSKRLRTFVFNS